MSERFLADVLDPGTTVTFTIHGEHQVGADWVVPYRNLPFHLLYYVTRRAIVGRVGGQDVRAEAGSLLWIMPGAMHEFWIESGSEPFSTRYFRVALHTHAVTGIAASSHVRLADDLVHVDDAWEAGQLMQQIVDELPSRLPLGQQRLRALLVLLFTSAIRLRDRQQQGGLNLSRSQRLKLTRLARQRVADRLSSADLAAELELSPDYFARLFRRSFGTSPRAWLVEQRIRQAAAALAESTRSVSQVAADFGYPDVFLFSRQFKQIVGVGPLAYRRGR